MLYKDDWEQAQERLKAFWANDCLGRPALGVTAPRGKPLPGAPEPKAPEDLVTRRTDPEYLAARADFALRQTYFAAEALPVMWPNLGPGVMAAYFGSPVTVHDGTNWFGEVIADWERDWPRFDENCWWWQRTLAVTEAVAEMGRGKFLVGITDLGGTMDIAASFRGSQRLQMDLIEHPEQVKRLRDLLVGRWEWCYDRLLAIARRCNGEGSTQWLSVWAPGKMYNIQCDLCCMISSPMFEEFVAPELQALCWFLDYSTYHLDGPGALHHLDRLLAIPELNGIQWTPGSGAPPSVEWLDLLRRCQRAGKLLHVHDEVSHAEKIIRGLSPEGLYLALGGVRSEEEAHDLVRLAGQWAAGPREG